ncbi:unnamed protein product [Allacma fusca]|uniref:Uncharacterized protein n=1 Tax=Allacma fusca TaxID=39272 RepID=A0A8J2L4D3_9HEXA|nr:unnamed protein product [Allacma fusca]
MDFLVLQDEKKEFDRAFMHMYSGCCKVDLMDGTGDAPVICDRVGAKVGSKELEPFISTISLSSTLMPKLSTFLPKLRRQNLLKNNLQCSGAREEAVSF